MRVPPREGLVVIRAIEACVRADFPAAPPNAQRLQKLVEEVSREPESRPSSFSTKREMWWQPAARRIRWGKSRRGPFLATPARREGAITPLPRQPAGRRLVSHSALSSLFIPDAALVRRGVGARVAVPGRAATSVGRGQDDRPESSSGDL